MQPTTPVIKGLESREVVYAKDQPDYLPLPTLRSPDGQVTSRWTLTPEERKSIAEGADVLLTIHTFNQLLQPIQMRILPENAHHNDFWRDSLGLDQIVPGPPNPPRPKNDRPVG